MTKKEATLAPLLKYLHSLQPLNVVVEKLLIDSFTLESLRKGDLLLQEGDVNEHLWFLAEGVLRAYHNIDDKEVISRIMFMGHLVICPGSFFTQTAATESIECLQDCNLAKISHAAIQNIYKLHPEFNFYGRVITEHYFYQQEQRLYMLRKPDSMAKYKFLINNFERFLENVPSKYVASFLGITPETLSRIRKKMQEEDKIN